MTRVVSFEATAAITGATDSWGVDVAIAYTVLVMVTASEGEVSAAETASASLTMTTTVLVIVDVLGPVGVGANESETADAAGTVAVTTAVDTTVTTEIDTLTEGEAGGDADGGDDDSSEVADAALGDAKEVDADAWETAADPDDESVPSEAGGDGCAVCAGAGEPRKADGITVVLGLGGGIPPGYESTKISS